MRRAQAMLALATAFAMDGCTAGSRTEMATPGATLFDGRGYRVARSVASYAPDTDGWTEDSLPLYSVRPAEESGFQ